jgi:signal peptidase
MKFDIYKIIYWIFLGFVGIIAAALILSILPIPGNIKVLTVLSGSMEPTLGTGSVVLIKPMENYKIGDIVTFGPYSKTKPPTTHRIYEVKIVEGQTFYVTKGDANNASDQREIRKSDILGKVLLSVPWAGYAIEAARKPWGFLAIVLVPAAFIAWDEAIKIKKELTKGKKPEDKKEENKDGDKKVGS